MYKISRPESIVPIVITIIRDLLPIFFEILLNIILIITVVNFYKRRSTIIISNRPNQNNNNNNQVQSLPIFRRTDINNVKIAFTVCLFSALVRVNLFVLIITYGRIPDSIHVKIQSIYVCINALQYAIQFMIVIKLNKKFRGNLTHLLSKLTKCCKSTNRRSRNQNNQLSNNQNSNHNHQNNQSGSNSLTHNQNRNMNDSQVCRSLYNAPESPIELKIINQNHTTFDEIENTGEYYCTSL